MITGELLENNSVVVTCEEMACDPGDFQSLINTLKTGAVMARKHNRIEKQFSQGLT